MLFLTYHKRKHGRMTACSQRSEGNLDSSLKEVLGVSQFFVTEKELNDALHAYIERRELSRGSRVYMNHALRLLLKSECPSTADGLLGTLKEKYCQRAI